MNLLHIYSINIKTNTRFIKVLYFIFFLTGLQMHFIFLTINSFNLSKYYVSKS